MHLLHLESDTDPRVEGDDGAPWRVIEEVGYGCSASKEFFQEVLGQQRLGAMDEGELAKLVGAIARTRSSLNVTSCAEALRSLCAATGAGPPPPRRRAWTTWNLGRRRRRARRRRAAPRLERRDGAPGPRGLLVPEQRFIRGPDRDVRARDDGQGALPDRGGVRRLGVATLAQGPAGPPLLRRRVAALPVAILAPEAPAARGRRTFRQREPVLEQHRPVPLAGGDHGGDSPRRRPDARRGGDERHPGDARGAGERVRGGDRARPRRGDGGGREQAGGFLADVAVATLRSFLEAGGHPNAARVLHGVWTSGPAGRECVVRAMAEAHAREGGGACVARMLDACQDCGAHDGARSRAARVRGGTRRAGGAAGVLESRKVAAGARGGGGRALLLGVPAVPSRQGHGRGPGPAERAEARGGDDDGVLQGFTGWRGRLASGFAGGSSRLCRRRRRARTRRWRRWSPRARTAA